MNSEVFKSRFVEDIFGKYKLARSQEASRLWKIFLQSDLRILVADLRQIMEKNQGNSGFGLDFIQKYCYRRLSTRLACHFLNEYAPRGDSELLGPHASLIMSQKLQQGGIGSYLQSVRGYYFQIDEGSRISIKSLVLCPDHFGRWGDGNDLPQIHSLRSNLAGKTMTPFSLYTPSLGDIDRIDFDSNLYFDIVLPYGFSAIRDRYFQYWVSPFSSGAIRFISEELAKGLMDRT